jgi:hypothetical protein
MAKKFSFTAYDKKHLANLARRATDIQALFREATQKGISIGEATGFCNPEGEFMFDKFPATKKRVDELFTGLHDNLLTSVEEGNREEWLLSAAKNDAMVDSLFGNKAKYGEIAAKWKSPNTEALEAFQERKTNGMGLSDRVWNLTKQFKSELEMALELGLGDGKSAADLSRDVRQYLNEPHKLFRRVRNEKGALRLSKAAKEYNPGRGVYRSSYKNALRLTATENNMAYRTADHDRWQQMDFVIGIEIMLSNNHTIKNAQGKAVRLNDICDELVGVYPKTFKFVGWHPFCRCIAVPKLADENEFLQQQQAIINGEETEGYEYSGMVTELPENFTQWVEDNAERIDAADTLPYFIKDNQAEIEVIVKGVQEDTTLYLNRETLAQMQERLGDQMPATLKNLQARIDRVENVMSTEMREAQKSVEERMQQMLDNGDFGMNIPLYSHSGDNVVEQIFNSKFKSQIETGTGKGMVDVDERKAASNLLFGTPATTNAAGYEKYGFLMEKDILAQAQSGVADQYWDGGDGIQVRFKKNKVLTTFTMGDSLCGSYQPSLTTNPSITSYGKSIYNGYKKLMQDDAPEIIKSAIKTSNELAYRYVEIQYHGELTLDCIESIFIPKDVLPELSSTLLKKMKATKATLYTESAEGKLIKL